MFTKENIITVYGFRDLYDGTYDATNKPDVIPPGKIIFCEISYIREFFEVLKRYPERKIILISGESDYGLVYQKEHFSNLDVFKAYYRVDWNKFGQETRYGKVELCACTNERCREIDKFAVKIDGFTACTFNEIPSNVVKWFTCNANVNEPQVEFLPFGVFDANESLLNEISKEHDKQNKLYVNFDVNTFDRFQLKNFYKNHQMPWITFRDKAIPYPEFLKEFAEHLYILSPKGNSMGDGYRHWESFYLKSMPIIEDSRWSRKFIELGYPAIPSPNIYGGTQESNFKSLQSYPLIFSSKLKDCQHLLDRLWWIDKIKKAVELI